MNRTENVALLDAFRIRKLSEITQSKLSFKSDFNDGNKF